MTDLAATAALPKPKRDLLPVLLPVIVALAMLPLIGSGSSWVTLTVASLAMGMMIFIMASGLTLVFGLMDVLNFGHGAFISVGAYVATLVLRSFAIDVPFLHEASVHWNGCVLVVLMLGCGCVVNTFGEIQRAIAIGAPKWVEWRAALCLLGSFVLLLQMVRRLLLNRSTRQLVWDVVSGALSRTSR